MEISVREMLRDVYPANRRKLTLDIVQNVKESRRLYFTSLKMVKKCESKALKCMHLLKMHLGNTRY